MKFQRVVLCVLVISTLGTATACTEYGGVHPDVRPLVDCLPPDDDDLECRKYRPPEPFEPPDPNREP